MMPEECPHYEKCNAPICPLDEESLKYAKKLKGEEHCSMKKDLVWLKSLPKEIRDLFKDGQI